MVTIQPNLPAIVQKAPEQTNVTETRRRSPAPGKGRTAPTNPRPKERAEVTPKEYGSLLVPGANLKVLIAKQDETEVPHRGGGRRIEKPPVIKLSEADVKAAPTIG